MDPIIYNNVLSVDDNERGIFVKVALGNGYRCRSAFIKVLLVIYLIIRVLNVYHRESRIDNEVELVTSAIIYYGFISCKISETKLEIICSINCKADFNSVIQSGSGLFKNQF